jgi:hypothetical protein
MPKGSHLVTMAVIAVVVVIALEKFGVVGKGAGR